MVTHDKANVKAGDWLRVQTPVDVVEFGPPEPYIVEGIAWKYESDNEVSQASGLYVGDVWLPHPRNVILEWRPA